MCPVHGKKAVLESCMCERRFDWIIVCMSKMWKKYGIERKNGTMDEQLKALLEGVNALKNGQEETRQKMQKGQVEMQKRLEKTRREMHKGLEDMQKSQRKQRVS
ncbi:hypothetical protein TNCV_1803091 [Trichonephila clavipes]|uniref:Uncharacterized protein n=1 Tax=Trichonephila clavipes TaxID=2585209 RepID=A0A8X6SL60_TRICX|nr:hypothetical protein TNCV_1803091 [Trichonephila clavipes]